MIIGHVLLILIMSFVRFPFQNREINFSLKVNNGALILRSGKTSTVGDRKFRQYTQQF